MSHEPLSQVALVGLTRADAQLDLDLVILITTVDPHAPRMCVERGLDGSSAAVITLVPSIELHEQPCEFVFLIDRSGSMQGSSMQQAVKAMGVGLRLVRGSSF